MINAQPAMSSTAFQNVVRLNPSDAAQVKAASELHIKLLPESVLSGLGHGFLSRFYYKLLPKAGLIDVLLYKHNNTYVGFIVCTKHPFSFMGDGIKKYFLQLVTVLGLAVITRPKRLGALLAMGGGIDLKGLQSRYGKSLGQFMSFGVLAEHRRVIDPEANLTIAHVMMKEVFYYFQQTTKERFFLLVLKDNQPAIQLYKKYNGYMTEGGDAKSDIYLFDLPK